MTPADPVGALGPQAADEPLVLPPDDAVVVALAAVAPLAGQLGAPGLALDLPELLRERQPALRLLVREDLGDLVGVAPLQRADVEPRCLDGERREAA